MDLCDLPPLSRTTDGPTASSSFSDVIQEVGDLPDPDEAQELEWAISEVIFSGEEDIRFEDARITARPVKSVEIEETVRRDNGTMHRIECEITGTSFYLPTGALVPVVVFGTSDSDDAEPWTERVHPRLVAEGPEVVMKALVSSYLRNELFDAAAELTWALQQLRVLREKGTLDGGWPDFGSSSNPSGYEVDEHEPVPGPDPSTEGRRSAP